MDESASDRVRARNLNIFRHARAAFPHQYRDHLERSRFLTAPIRALPATKVDPIDEAMISPGSNAKAHREGLAELESFFDFEKYAVDHGGTTRDPTSQPQPQPKPGVAPSLEPLGLYTPPQQMATTLIGSHVEVDSGSKVPDTQITVSRSHDRILGSHIALQEALSRAAPTTEQMLDQQRERQVYTASPTAQLSEWYTPRSSPQHIESSPGPSPNKHQGQQELFSDISSAGSYSEPAPLAIRMRMGLSDNLTSESAAVYPATSSPVKYKRERTVSMNDEEVQETHLGDSTLSPAGIAVTVEPIKDQDEQETRSFSCAPGRKRKRYGRAPKAITRNTRSKLSTIGTVTQPDKPHELDHIGNDTMAQTDDTSATDSTQDISVQTSENDKPSTFAPLKRASRKVTVGPREVRRMQFDDPNSAYCRELINNSKGPVKTRAQLAAEKSAELSDVATEAAALMNQCLKN